MTAFFIWVFAFYFLFLVLLIIGWRKTSVVSVTKHRFYFLSVIIPFRNEESCLPALLDSIQKLNYPKDRFEVLLVDDHSTDGSAALIKKLTPGLPNCKVIFANSNGKKNAITQGIDESTGDIIVTTDADCELPVDWLQSINTQFLNQSICMLMGPVRIKSNDTLFSKLQAVEFSSLIGSAAATLNLGFPMMCNGANLSYTKESFIEVNGFQGNEHIPSGDDEFLMRKIVKKFGAGSLRFLNDSNALVTTNPPLSLKDFLSQRIRWAGKWRYNSNALTRIIAVWVLMFHFSWLLAIGFIIFQPMNNTIVGLIVVKIAVEGFFLFMISKFMRQKFSLSAFLLLQIFYPLYVITVGIFSNVIRASWKGRPIPN